MSRRLHLESCSCENVKYLSSIIDDSLITSDVIINVDEKRKWYHQLKLF